MSTLVSPFSPRREQPVKMKRRSSVVTFVPVIGELNRSFFIDSALFSLSASSGHQALDVLRSKRTRSTIQKGDVIDEFLSETQLPDSWSAARRLRAVPSGH